MLQDIIRAAVALAQFDVLCGCASQHLYPGIVMTCEDEQLVFKGPGLLLTIGGDCPKPIVHRLLQALVPEKDPNAPA